MNRFYYILALVVLIGCSNPNKTAKTVSTLDFPIVKVPGIYTNGNDRLQFSAFHYWDSFTDTSRHYACDSTLISGVLKEDVERQVATYIALLQTVPLKLAQDAMVRTFERIEDVEKANPESNVFEQLTEMFSRYLYDPNSPSRSEDIYLPFVKRLATSELTKQDHIRYEHEVKMCSLNQIGTKVPDFYFTDLSGKRQNLYSIKAPSIILFFSNPGCPNCREITEKLMSNEKITKLIEANILKVVNVYIDKELDEWKAYADDYPKSWISGYNDDFSIREDITYNVRAIPSLYLIDFDKVVVLKDAPEDKVIQALETEYFSYI